MSFGLKESFKRTIRCHLFLGLLSFSKMFRHREHTDPPRDKRQGISCTSTPSQLSRLSPFSPSVSSSSSKLSTFQDTFVGASSPARRAPPPQLDPPLHLPPQVLPQPHPYLLIVRQLQPFSRPLILTTSGFLTEQIDVCGSDGARSCSRAGDIGGCVPGTSSSSIPRFIFLLLSRCPFCIPCIRDT